MQRKTVFLVILFSFSTIFMTQTGWGAPYAQEEIIFPGSSCQPRYGDDQIYLVHGYQGIGNSLGGPGSPVVEVVCGIHRPFYATTQSYRVEVNVYRSVNAGNTPLTCSLQLRDDDTGALTYTQTQSFSGIGNKRFNFGNPNSNPGDYYIVACVLPYEGAVRSIALR